MADIDKDLPNVDQELKIPSPEEIEVAEQEKQQEVDEQGNPVDSYRKRRWLCRY